ncbi:MAG: CDP-glycerol glycerophosphotransferase family protein [Akkermansia sp.]
MNATLAYLDPGSGSALLAAMFAVVTASLYSLKALYYKILGKQVSSKVGSDTPILFSEGKSYYTSFEPIINELIRRKIHFRYVSLDMHDPALMIESEYMHSKLYSRSGLGFAKIEGLQAPLMLATTPHIGADSYPLARPRKVKHLVHFFHDYVAGTYYRLGGLDHYDVVISTGEYCREYLERVEEKRQTPKKEIIALGLPYVDTLSAQLAQVAKPAKTDEKKTILVAPSWGMKGCLNNYGTAFIKDLIKQGYQVIIRLHSHSYIAEPQKVAQWKTELSQTGAVWDEDIYSTNSMLQADVLISDTSSIRFDFAFLHLKPVITLDIPQASRADFEASYHEKTWDMIMEHQIGAVVTQEKISELPEIIKQVLENYDSQRLQDLRDHHVVNFGQCAKPIVSFLEELKNRKIEA